MKYFSLLAFGLIIASCSHSPVQQETQAPPQVKGVTFLYQSNRQGNMEPCGCDTTPYGGLDREWNLIQELKSKQIDTVYLDAGNTFVPKDLKFKKIYYEAKARHIAEILAKFPVQGILPGVYDLKLGVPFFKKLGEEYKLPFVVSNLVDSKGTPVFKTHHVFTLHGVRYGVVGVLPEKLKLEKNYRIKPFVKEVWPTLKTELKAKADVLILLSQWPSKEVDQLVSQASDFALVVGGDETFALEKANWTNQGKTLILEPENFGYTLGQLIWNVQLPFQGSFSPKEVAEHKETIQIYEKKLAQNPQDKNTQLELDFIKKFYAYEPISNGSAYENTLVKLTKEAYGAPNEVSKMIETSKEALKKVVIDSSKKSKK